MHHAQDELVRKLYHGDSDSENEGWSPVYGSCGAIFNKQKLTHQTPDIDTVDPPPSRGVLYAESEESEEDAGFDAEADDEIESKPESALGIEAPLDDYAVPPDEHGALVWPQLAGMTKEQEAIFKHPENIAGQPYWPPEDESAQPGPSSGPSVANLRFVCHREGCTRPYSRQCDLECVLILPP